MSRQLKMRIRALLTTLFIGFAMSGTVSADGLKLPAGMGGVPDIGAIPCNVFTEMLVIGPLGTRHSLLTWANGYYYGTTGKTIDELLAMAASAGQQWDFYRLTDHLAAFCEKNPDAITRAAAMDLANELASGG